MVTCKTGNIVIVWLLLFGLAYGAHFTKQHIVPFAIELHDDSAENSEENVKEISSHLFLHEKQDYRLNPIVSIALSLNAYIEAPLPEAYLQLNTPPPDFA